jgi:hypothetical protein
MTRCCIQGSFIVCCEAPVDMVGVPAILAALVGCLFTAGDKSTMTELGSLFAERTR